MSKLPTHCPACSAALEVTRLACPSCAVGLDGNFELPALLRLGRDDLELVTEFVRASGSLKEMCKLLGQSYPTVRNRLDEIIRQLAPHPGKGKGDDERRTILAALAKGELTVSEATRRLRRLDS